MTNGGGLQLLSIRKYFNFYKYLIDSDRGKNSAWPEPIFNYAKMDNSGFLM